MKILVTGGTVFVSKFVTTYFTEKGYEVFTLNRGNREQVKGSLHIKADRSSLNGCLKNFHFDAVIDVCGYNEADIKNLLNGLTSFDDYIFISSSAVYPETLLQPFNEKNTVGENTLWGAYGINKIAAEKHLVQHCPNSYILRPPYLYGPMQNLYREPFVFECAEANRKFYIPKDGKMKLQFFHVEDLCRVIEAILDKHPENHIFNVGNKEILDINTFVDLCYKAVGTTLKRMFVRNHPNQRDYFSFLDYEYVLDVSKMEKLLPVQKNLSQGLKQSYEWYKEHKSDVVRKPYIDFIEKNFRG